MFLFLAVTFIKMPSLNLHIKEKKIIIIINTSILKNSIRQPTISTHKSSVYDNNLPDNKLLDVSKLECLKK